MKEKDLIERPIEDIANQEYQKEPEIKNILTNGKKTVSFSIKLSFYVNPDYDEDKLQMMVKENLELAGLSKKIKSIRKINHREVV